MLKIKLRQKNLILICLLAIFFHGCSKGGVSTSSSKLTPPSLIDPFLNYAWHLKNTGQSVFASTSGTSGVDLNLTQTWADGYLGESITILVSDDGVESTHEDLKDNYNVSGLSKNYTLSSPYTATTSDPIMSDDNHGTAVAGLIAAVGGNAFGAKGVAPKAKLVSANFMSSAVVRTTTNYADQANGNFDVFNMSWGQTQNAIGTTTAAFLAQLKYGVTNLRSGKGANYVKAAGNDFAVTCNIGIGTCLGNANFDSSNTTPYTTNVAALNALGESSSYSSIGSNIWISSFGGEYGHDSPAMLTTDRTGCSTGFALSSTSSTLSFESGGAGNSLCQYTLTFNGTSSAAPTLSGVVALLLSVNSNLSWRDVRHILASTATTTNSLPSSIGLHPLSSTLPTGYAWEQGWVTNGAGFKFHNWYGFGQVNVDAAVAMAKSYTSSLGTYEESNWTDENTGLSVAIPDNSAVGGSNTISVANTYKIESVQLKVWITHSDISELALELTSPSGTKSIVVNAINALKGVSNYAGEILLTNAFYQETANGNWTLKVVDAKSGNTGTLTRWSLNFMTGH